MIPGRNDRANGAPPSSEKIQSGVMSHVIVRIHGVGATSPSFAGLPSLWCLDYLIRNLVAWKDHHVRDSGCWPHAFVTGSARGLILDCSYGRLQLGRAFRGVRSAWGGGNVVLQAGVRASVQTQSGILRIEGGALLPPMFEMSQVGCTSDCRPLLASFSPRSLELLRLFSPEDLPGD